jgi:predicted Zn-dependent peptidase
MVEDTPDDLVHEMFAEGFWSNHPLGRPILGTPHSVSSLSRNTLTQYFAQTYVAQNFVVVAVGNLEHGRVQDLLERALVNLPHQGPDADQSAPVVAPMIQVRKKELEQSHIVFGTEALPQHHPERYAGYALNTTLGGSMSSRLFQNVREKRGLAYSVFSGLSAYQDAGALSIYAGCANEAVAELIDVVVAEIRQMKAGGLAPVELRRAKDHLKGSLMLGLESTSSRMSHLARQEMYRDSTFGLDEMLAAIEKVTEADVLRLADRFFTNGSLAVTVLGNVNGLQVTKEQLAL